ncbi:hypothetical protein Btru_077466 [Bulinus truncatus]|nr:hypothetical protein Btru_077466 [Bulinus truncatus]
MAWLLAVLVLLTCGSKTESKLTITVQPKVPVGLVKPLEIRCTFESAQDLGYKPYDIQILNGRNTVLATISRDNAPEVKNDKDRLTVEGQLVSGKSDAYLKAAWKRSASNLSGNYTCLARARNDAGLETLFIAHQIVAVKKPQLEGMLNYLQEMATADDIAQRKNDQEMDSLRRALTVSANRITDLAAIQNSTKLHFEEGSVNCGDSDSFKEKTAGWETAKENRIPVVFKTPYSKAPSVIMEFRQIDFDQRYGTRFFVNARDVTATGFTVVCGTWWDTKIYGVNVYWHTVNT